MAITQVTMLIGVTFIVVASVEAVSGCIQKEVFGSYQVPEKGMQEHMVHSFTLTNDRIIVQVMEYGATLTSIKVPDRMGKLEDIVLGYNSLQGYFNADNPYYGATVGRVANRISRGQFTLDGVVYHLNQNEASNTLHGGLRGFDKKLWSGRIEDNKVVMEYISEDGEEGFPGQVKVSVTFSLTKDSILVIEYHATSNKRTPINLTNHAYFNLAGQGAGAVALYKHLISIKAEQITETDLQNLPTGKLMAVQGTPFDLRQLQNLGEAIRRTPANGFDNNFVLPQCHKGLTIAEVVDPNSGRRLEVETSQPGIQFYTSNSDTPIKGKSTYSRHAGFALETQNFPDAINHINEFPNSVIGPGETYYEVTKYKFGIAEL